jgi:D-alanyl-D-alanine carboxypeptidase (penicillin-binding protein 5/6)
LRILPALLLAALPLLSRAAAPPVPPPPLLDATAWVLVDQQSGQVLAGQRVDEPVEPASITKLMSAYAVFKALKDGKLELGTEVPISEHAWRSEGSRTYLEVGTRAPVEVLIQGMIVQSGNDATIALAEAVAGTEDTFAALMNQYAERLGMRQSHFQNSTGLPGDNHKMSVGDMAKLTRAIIREFPDYYRWYSQREFTWNKISQPNRNGLLGHDGVDGMKTGHTESAGYCLVTSANRDGMRLISVVMGSPSWKVREQASQALLNYGFSFFETRKLHGAGQKLATTEVWKAEESPVALGLRRDLYLTVQRGRFEELKSTTTVKPRLIAPIPANTAVGELQVTLGDQVLVKRPLYPVKEVKQGGLWTRMVDSVLLWFE